MKLLKKDLNLESFFEKVAAAKNRALLLDYDGTLAPFKVERDKAVPYQGVCRILDELLENNNCRIVIISGRWTKDLTPLLKLKKMPEIWGSHGWERLMPDKSYILHKISEHYLQGLTEADDLMAKEGLQNRYERKPGCLAIHWRGLDKKQIEKIRDKVLKYWKPITIESGLTIQEFDGGIELRAPGRNKGDVIKDIVSEMPDDVMVAYLGDDLTDEDAFEAIAQDGLGVLVNEKLRQTSASLWIEPPEELLQFLKMWKDSL